MIHKHIQMLNLDSRKHIKYVYLKPGGPLSIEPEILALVSVSLNKRLKRLQVSATHFRFELKTCRSRVF